MTVFYPEHAHLFLHGVYGDFLHHNDELHLNGGVLDNAVCQSCWFRLATQLASCYTTASVAVGRHFTSILATEWQEVLGRTWNSKRPLVFAHVVLTKTLVVCRAREIRDQITRMVELWERGLHTDLVGDAESEGSEREGRAASGGEEEDEAVARSCHRTVLLGKLRQAVHWETERGWGRVSSPG